MLLDKRYIFDLRLRFFTTISLLYSSRTWAQTVMIDTLAYPFLSLKDSVLPKKKLSHKPAGDFDQRFSFIENEGVSIWSYRIGALVNDEFKVGIGVYF
jgi:hypothetical protein